MRITNSVSVFSTDCECQIYRIFSTHLAYLDLIELFSSRKYFWNDIFETLHAENELCTRNIPRFFTLRDDYISVTSRQEQFIFINLNLFSIDEEKNETVHFWRNVFRSFEATSVIGWVETFTFTGICKTSFGGHAEDIMYFIL